MERSTSLGVRIVQLFLAYQPLPSLADSCKSQERILAEAEAVFAVIPMKGELSLDRDLTQFEVDVHQVWRGTVNRVETVYVAMPRMLSLGDEFVLATSRNIDGYYYVQSCTPIISTHNQDKWIEDNLGQPIYEYLPDIYVPRDVR
ncbi:MAG: hypothetical protein GKR90_17555 [Pseudomonadales bacterium]|nr:hypothetical protein [Pseudomonadales bacterium]